MKHYLYECTDPDSECDGEESLWDIYETAVNDWLERIKE